MLGNLKLVLLQHKRFLAIFFLIVFLPSIILAVFGIRAIQNERYKLRHQTRVQQAAYVEAFQEDVLSLIERVSSSLREISLSRALVDQDYSAIHDLISLRSQELPLLGRTVIWDRAGSPWIPGLQERPSSAEPFAVPSEWSMFQPELARAEEAEFRRRNYSEAAALYNQILGRAGDRHVKVWIQSRIARCEAKQGRFKQALEAYRTILADFSDLHTESGRPLGFVTSLQILDALRADNDSATFFPEALEIYERLEQNVWSLDGDQLFLYTNMLQDQIDEAAAKNPLDSEREEKSQGIPKDSPWNLPADYAASVDKFRNSIDEKLVVWRTAKAVQNNILPGLKDRLAASTIGSPQVRVHRDSVEMDGSEALALILPLSNSSAGQPEAFLGSLIPDRDILTALDPLITEERPPGVSLILRSMLTGKVIYGSGSPKASNKGIADTSNVVAAAHDAASDVTADAAAGDGIKSESESSPANPVLEDFFPENFPPWKVEVYGAESLSAGPSLYKNIFFWTILALLVILFLGSGLIIRTIVHEVNLLNLKSDFIASVSHEFKTPLTAMGAILERLLDGEITDPQKAREYYQILSHDSERLKRLVKNVLDFTKIEEGKRKYRMASLDIVELVRREVESFENENKISGFTVGVEIAGDIHSAVADEEALRQALHNILDNAAKFSAREKAIELQVIRRKDTIAISVTDHGIGIPENEQKRIFEKFFRGKQAASVSPTGTGLGLTLVKHIMTAHGGDVTIQSAAGEGSRVSLVLPIREGE